MDRLLVIDKPSGLTSHDVVERIRRSSRATKVGHAGTLDPQATGVLLVLTGRATRLAQFLQTEEKEYRGCMVLGVATDTDDREGRVISRCDASSLRAADVERAFAAFVGTIRQVPPMVSAIKRSGTPLYVLARRGIVVDRPPRTVVVKGLRLIRFESPVAEFDVTCLRGVYVRSLASDVGAALGCGAHLAELRRIRVGDFHVDRALSLESAMALGTDVGRAGFSMLEALASAPILVATDQEARAIALGASIEVGGDRLPDAPGVVRVTRDGRELLAVAVAARREAADEAGTATVRPLRVFVDGRSRRAGQEGAP